MNGRRPLLIANHLNGTVFYSDHIMYGNREVLWNGILHTQARINIQHLERQLKHNTLQQIGKQSRRKTLFITENKNNSLVGGHEVS